MGSIPAILSDSSVVCQDGPTAHPLLAVISNSGMAIPDSTNTDPPRTKTHLAFAGNLRAVITASGQSVASWARAHRLEARNLQRIMRGEQSPTLDTMEDIAHACGLQPWQMLMPDIDLSNPPVFVMSKVEADLYARVKADFATLPQR